MSNYDSLLAAKNQTIKVLSIAIIIPSVLALVMAAGWILAPSNIVLRIPPDLSNGATMKIDEIPKTSVYSFTYYIFQQLNRWMKNGEEDYYTKIHSLQAYMTPSCFQDRLDDFEIKKRNHELSDRERSVSEIPGRSFSNSRVRVTSNSSWIVSLDLHVTETYRGEKVKDRLINYPIKVVRYNVDAEKNPWGLALDCYSSSPRIISISQKEGEL